MALPPMVLSGARSPKNRQIRARPPTSNPLAGKDKSGLRRGRSSPVLRGFSNKLSHSQVRHEQHGTPLQEHETPYQDTASHRDVPRPLPHTSLLNKRTARPPPLASGGPRCGETHRYIMVARFLGSRGRHGIGGIRDRQQRPRKDHTHRDGASHSLIGRSGSEAERNP